MSYEYVTSRSVLPSCYSFLSAKADKNSYINAEHSISFALQGSVDYLRSALESKRKKTYLLYPERLPFFNFGVETLLNKIHFSF
jgi:hypothetical protein